MVCSDQSGVGHGITWRHALSAKRVEIEGASAFAVSGLSFCPTVDTSIIYLTYIHVSHIKSCARNSGPL